MWWQMLDYLSFLLGIACVGLAILVWEKSGAEKKLIYIFALFGTSMGLWMISVGVADLTSSLPALVIWTKIATIVSTLGVVSFAAFAQLFKKPNTPPRRWLLWIIPVVLISLYVITFPNAQVYTADPFINRDPTAPLGGVVNDNYALYIPFVFLFIIWSLVVLLRGRKQLPHKIRNQTYYLAAGTTVMMFSGILFDSVLPVLGIDYLYSLGPALAIVWVGATAYAIARHELMDIRIIIQRGVIYSILFTIIAGIYLMLIFGLSSVVNFTDKTITLVSGLLAVLLGIFGIPPLEKYFRHVTDKFFFKERYDYAQTLHELSAILNTSLEERQIIDRTEALLTRALRADRIRLSSVPVDADFHLKIPLLVNERSVGTLAVGKKLSGDAWNSFDLKLLDTFAYQAAIALEKSRLHQELKRQELGEQQKMMMIDIAHNLQTPLTALQAELTSKNPDFASLEKSISEVSKFIYDLLTLARLESNIHDPNISRVSLSDLAADVLDYVHTLAQEEQIELICNLETDVQVEGNKEELKTLIINLLSNAIKYTKSQSPARIIVNLSQNSGQAKLVVSDTGVGIPPEELPNLFQRFYRANSKPTPGTGLGLAICKAIVEKHGGSISISSAHDSGTEATVTLPLLRLA